MSIIEESDGSAAAATSYTDEFFDAACTKIDAAFGKGFAKANPALLGAMIQASATNLVAFMQAATVMQPSMFDMMSEEDLLPEPPRKPKKGGR